MEKVTKCCLSPDKDAADYTDEFLRENPVFREFLVHGLADPQHGPAYATNPLVKYRVLSGGIPALSYAVAANPLSNAQGNFDMQIQFKTDQQWPSEEHSGDATGDWLHGDFRNVALSYVYGMYEKMIELGGLDEE